MKPLGSDLRPKVDSRLITARVIMALSVLFLGIGLFLFQIRHADRYVQLALDNRLRMIRLPRVRGQIYDRHGRPLAMNVTVFDIMAYPLDLTEETKDAFLTALEHQGIPMTADELNDRIKRRFWAPYRAISLVSNLTLTQMTSLMNSPNFPRRLFPLPLHRRDYPAGPLTAHVVGQVGEISEAELAASVENQDGYVGGDVIGKGGVEKFYEVLLRGTPGEMSLQVDARGRPRGELDSQPPIVGQDLTLTIDLAVQQYAATLLEGFRGAVVAMNIHNGEILALYSNPTFDPNPLAWGISVREWQALLNDPSHPMLDRAISAQYSPGSIWKALTGYTALESGLVTPKTRFRCTGAYKLGPQTYRCWQRWGHGWETIHQALRDSCDVYFYNTSQMVGIERYLNVARRFGLNRPLGIDLPGEASGNLAGPEWKKVHHLGPWYKGDTVNYSIGQGYLLLTPLQMVSLFATIANGGTVVQPHVNKALVPYRRDARLDKKSLQVIRDGLKAVTARGGTGWRAGVWGVSVAGKTGTVQNSHGEDHAVFVGYAPIDKPQYAVVYFLEEGKGGGREAAPRVAQLLAFLVRQNEGMKVDERKQ